MTREEALNKVRQMSLPKETMEILEALAPELKESEDERIRKNLIELLLDTPAQDIISHNLELSKVLAYLEKQKEQKHPDGCFTCDEYKKGYEEGRRNGFTAGYNKAMKEVEQKEQKPADNEKVEITDFEQSVYDLCPVLGIEEAKATASDLLELAKKTLLKTGKVVLASNYPEGCSFEDGFHLGYNEGFNAKQEQKPAEKQDYSGLNDLERAIHRGFLCAGVENVPVAIIKQTAKECIAQMKPAEWSEDWREEDIQTRFAFYTYKDDSSVLYLSNVFVEETSRNHGFGTRILKAAEKVAETIGATTISLKVKQDSPANAWYRKNGYGYVAFEDGYDWLEKNLEYMKPNKQEWSKKDEIMIGSLINYFEGDALDCSTEDVVNWLKSLRPSWKPSEEQMEILQYVCTQSSHPNQKVIPVLESLYNDLKKL